jgi:hypothetical protein
MDARPRDAHQDVEQAFGSSDLVVDGGVGLWMGRI